MSIVIFSTPNCGQCVASKMFFKRKNLEFTEVDLSTNPDELKRLQDLGFSQAPVIEANGERWSGFRPDKIQQLVG